MTIRGHYEVLGLAPFADSAMVDQAYWHLAKTYQTLVVADPRARESLDELNDAYAVLATPRLREEYDATLAGGLSPNGQPQDQGQQRKRLSLRLPRISLPGWPSINRSSQAQDNGARTVTQIPDESRSRPRSSATVTAAEVKHLRASTERMLERWRTNANLQLRPTESTGSQTPDSTLVDIFKTEKELDAHGDPLTAVMEILKAPAQMTSAGSDGLRR